MRLIGQHWRKTEHEPRSTGRTEKAEALTTTTYRKAEKVRKGISGFFAAVQDYRNVAVVPRACNSAVLQAFSRQVDLIGVKGEAMKVSKQNLEIYIHLLAAYHRGFCMVRSFGSGKFCRLCQFFEMVNDALMFLFADTCNRSLLHVQRIV